MSLANMYNKCKKGFDGVSEAKIKFVKKTYRKEIKEIINKLREAGAFAIFPKELFEVIAPGVVALLSDVLKKQVMSGGSRSSSEGKEYITPEGLRSRPLTLRRRLSSFGSDDSRSPPVHFSLRSPLRNKTKKWCRIKPKWRAEISAIACLLCFVLAFIYCWRDLANSQMFKRTYIAASDLAAQHTITNVRNCDKLRNIFNVRRLPGYNPNDDIGTKEARRLLMVDRESIGQYNRPHLSELPIGADPMSMGPAVAAVPMSLGPAAAAVPTMGSNVAVSPSGQPVLLELPSGAEASAFPVGRVRQPSGRVRQPSGRVVPADIAIPRQRRADVFGDEVSFDPENECGASEGLSLMYQFVQKPMYFKDVIGKFDGSFFKLFLNMALSGDRILKVIAWAGADGASATLISVFNNLAEDNMGPVGLGKLMLDMVTNTIGIKSMTSDIGTGLKEELEIEGSKFTNDIKRLKDLARLDISKSQTKLYNGVLLMGMFAMMAAWILCSLVISRVGNFSLGDTLFFLIPNRLRRFSGFVDSNGNVWNEDNYNQGNRLRRRTRPQGFSTGERHEFILRDHDNMMDRRRTQRHGRVRDIPRDRRSRRSPVQEQARLIDYDYDAVDDADFEAAATGLGSLFGDSDSDRGDSGGKRRSGKKRRGKKKGRRKRCRKVSRKKKFKR